MCYQAAFSWFQGGMSVDSITDLDDSESRLLEALQLSHPHELESKRDKGRVTKLSLNPIYRQVPRIMDSCCQHIETYGECILVALIGYWGICSVVTAVIAEVFICLIYWSLQLHLVHKLAKATHAYPLHSFNKKCSMKKCEGAQHMLSTNTITLF